MPTIKNQKECPFCRSEISEITFAESEKFLAVYNISPILPGHSLVIPKKHIESLMDLDDFELCEFMRLGRDAAKILLKAFNTDAFNWTIQEKEAAGQTVTHLHMHIIPRNTNDLPEPGDWYPLLRKQENSGIIDSESRPKLKSEEVKNIVKHIKKVAQAIR